KTALSTRGGVQSARTLTEVVAEERFCASKATKSSELTLSRFKSTTTLNRPSAPAIAVTTVAPPVTRTLAPGSALPVMVIEDAHSADGTGSRTGAVGPPLPPVVKRETNAELSLFPARSATFVLTSIR